VELWNYPSGGPLAEIGDVVAAYTIPTDINLRGITHDGSDRLYFVITKTADSKNYLWVHAITAGTNTELGEFNISLMLSRNVLDTARGFEVAGTRLYDVLPDMPTSPTVAMQDISSSSSFTTGSVIIAVTESHAIVELLTGAIEVWDLVNVGTTAVKTCAVQANILMSPTYITTCTMTTRASDGGMFTGGDVVTLLDGFGTTAFRGRVVERVINRGRAIITATGVERELAAHATRTLAEKTMETVFTDMLDTRGWLNYTTATIDPDASFDGVDFSAAATTDPCSGWHVVWLLRIGELAIVHATPDGTIWAQQFNDLTADGRRIKQAIGQFRIARAADNNGLRVVNTGVTRASVTHASKTRTTYTGATTVETGNGMVEATDIIEPNIAAADTTLATEIATNVYTVLATTTSFLALTARNQGYIQPGHSVDVSWDEGNVVVPRATMCVLGWDWDARNDVMMLTLGTGIATPHEMDALELDCDGKHEPA
jgi:hypothetical protein